MYILIILLTRDLFNQNMSITEIYLQGHMAKNFYNVQDLGQNVSKIVSCIQQLNAGMSLDEQRASSYKFNSFLKA